MARSGPVVVDTDVLIDFFAGVSPMAEAVERLVQEGRLALSAISVFELACGAQQQAQLDDIELLVQAGRVVSVDVPAALRAGAQGQRLRARGQGLDPADLLIAGCCLAMGWPLLTRNRRHFSRIPELNLVEARQLLS